MRTGTPASYAVCQASSLLILSILASYAVCQTARPLLPLQQAALPVSDTSPGIE
jgi:hypothetical protein